MYVKKPLVAINKPDTDTEYYLKLLFLYQSTRAVNQDHESRRGWFA